MNTNPEKKLMQQWCWLTAGAGVWWLIGLNLFFYHAAALLFLLGFIHKQHARQKGAYLPFSAVLLFLIACVYFASVCINSAGGESRRIVAALYNVSFWILGGIFVTLMANIFTLASIRPILKTLCFLAWTTGLLALAMLAVWMSGTKSVIIKTPLYGLTEFFGYAPLLEGSVLARPLMWDWFASVTRPRFNVFSPYPTACGAILMIILMMLISWAQLEKKTRSPVFWGLFLSNLLGLSMTLSRMSVVAFVLAVGIVFIVQNRHFALWLFVIAGLIAVLYPVIQNFLEFMLSLREGSNSVRMEIYRASLAQLEGPDWLFGRGLKPRDEDSPFSLGSHSTYISLIFKSGLSGGLLFLLFQSKLLLSWYAMKDAVTRKREVFIFWRGLGMVLIGMAMWAVTEDIDAPQFLAMLYFSCVGFFEGLRRELEHE